MADVKQMKKNKSYETIPWGEHDDHPDVDKLFAEYMDEKLVKLEVVIAPDLPKRSLPKKTKQDKKPKKAKKEGNPNNKFSALFGEEDSDSDYSDSESE